MKSRGSDRMPASPQSGTAASPAEKRNSARSSSRSKQPEEARKELREYAARPAFRQDSGSLEESSGREFGPASAVEKRRKQLQYVQEFFRNPSIIDLRDAPITTSSSPQEVEQRKAELRYRIELVEAFLAVFREELELLSKIKGGQQG